MLKTFATHESEVRSYCRSFPTVFTRAAGSEMFDAAGRRYLDFFAGAGALNYGHNPEALRAPLLAYIEAGGITHSLDMATAAKAELLERFARIILEPRGLRYKVQFPGPTGTNAVEAALKLARKVTGRRSIISFTNAFHGMTLGSLAVTGNGFKRAGAGVSLGDVTVMPFDGYLGEGVDTLDYLEAALAGGGSGVERPAAFIFETLQAEGGIRVASTRWLQRLAAIAEANKILLIIDDIQVGCGRTGPFFSFESAGLDPDIVCLSKSLSGYGLPFAVTLLRPELDVWSPGEHNGTFRGHNLAFVTASAALDWWLDDGLQREVARKGAIVRNRLHALALDHPELGATVRGRGLLQGLAFTDATVAGSVAREAFQRGLICETAGPDSGVLKLMPPLVIDDALLDEGLGIVEASVAAVTARVTRSPSRSAGASLTAPQA